MNNKQKSAFSKLSFLFKKSKKTDIEESQNTDKEAVVVKQPQVSEQKVVKEEQKHLPDKLVSNLLAGTTTGVWEYPSPALLSEDSVIRADRGDINKIASSIEKTLHSFGIDSRVAEANLGPSVTQYAIEIGQGTRISKITALAEDLALATEAPTGHVRIEAPIPGRNLIGLEIPNRSLEIVTLRTMVTSEVMQKAKSKLTVALGLDVSGNPLAVDIAKMPHVLITGTSDSGKSTLLNSFLASLLFRASPQEVRLILIDPKRLDFTSYNGIPHLLTPVIVDTSKAISALKWTIFEMDKRYKLFTEKGVRNIDSYNELTGFQALPYIAIVVDELADVMAFAKEEIEDLIINLARRAGATGIHLVLASDTSFSEEIKEYINCRIALKVINIRKSEEIIKHAGAEMLFGHGDMFYLPPDQAKPTRIQGPYVSEKEIKKLVEFLKSRNYPTEYTEEATNQSLPLKKGGSMGTSADGNNDEIEEAIKLVCQFNTATASFLQRKMSLGYAKAARILDQLEEMGIIGPAEGAKPRDVLVRNAEEFLQGSK